MNCWFVEGLLILALFLEPAFGRTPPQESKEALGSLSSVGEVLVNDAPAPPESTIFPGDRLQTGDTGTAVFTMSGKGTLKIAPRAQVVFTGSYLYTMELQSGRAVLSSAGANGIILRVRNFVLVPSTRESSATSKIEEASGDSFLVSCLEGSVDVVTMEGKSGELLHSGESLNVSSNTSLTPFFKAPKRQGQILHPTWVLFGAAGAGGIAALGMTLNGGKHSVSPSTP